MSAADELRAWIRGDRDDQGNPVPEEPPVAERKADPAQGAKPGAAHYNGAELNGEELLAHLARGLGGERVRINNQEF